MIAQRHLRRWLLAAALLGLLAGAGAWLLGAPPPFVAACWLLASAPQAVMVAVDFLRGLRNGKIGVDLIALLAIVSAAALGEALTAAIIAIMVAGGGALEELAEARARRELSALLSRTPRSAHRIEPDGLHDIATASVQPGDRLLIKPGEAVPVDGRLANAAAVLDEAALTGEPPPVSRAPGEAVRSGVVNAGGPFELLATTTEAAGTYAAVVRLVHAAEAERPPMVRLADIWALWFLGLTVLVAGLAWWATGSATRALAVLVVATPCPMILAAPVALICGVSRAAQRGIIVKGGGVLERLSRAGTVLFDKTGTLTTGTPRLAGVATMEGFARDAVLRLAASLDQHSTHVSAVAIVAAARAAGLTLGAPTEVVEAPGAGLTGRVDGVAVAVGTVELLAMQGLHPPTDGATARLAAGAASASWVAVGGQVAGALLLADHIRPEAPRAVRGLRAAGLDRIVMVTGDRADAAQAVGETLGLDAVFAALDPIGKIAVLRRERAQAATIMVGDGINDAPSLAAADVGIAMGARGAAAAADAADVVLLVDRLDRVVEARTIAQRARFIALQCVLVGMGLSALAMAVAALGYLPPVAGAVLQEVIDVAAILNALRVLVGGNAPAPLTDREAVGRVVADHARLRGLLERMRRTADQLGETGTMPPADLAAINAELNGFLLSHQADEERLVFPELALRLGGRDPLAMLARLHEEIADLAHRFAALVDGLLSPEASAAEADEARRLLYVLDAMVALHIAVEEAALSEVEDLPV